MTDDLRRVVVRQVADNIAAQARDTEARHPALASLMRAWADQLRATLEAERDGCQLCGAATHGIEQCPEASWMPYD
jgi:hypothetical protein